MPTVAVRTPKAIQTIRSVEDIDRDLARFAAEGETCTRAVEDAKAACDRLDDARRALIERQVIEPDATAEAQLEANADQIVAADRTRRDAETRAAVIDRKLTELRASRTRAIRAEQTQAVRRVEAEAAALERAVQPELAVLAEKLGQLSSLRLEAYSMRNRIGESVGRTPKRQIADLVLNAFSHLAPQYLDRPWRDPLAQQKSRATIRETIDEG